MLRHPLHIVADDPRAQGVARSARTLTPRGLNSECITSARPYQTFFLQIGGENRPDVPEAETFKTPRIGAAASDFLSCL